MMMARTCRRNWKFFVGSMLILSLCLLVFKPTGQGKLPATPHDSEVHKKIIYRANEFNIDESMKSYISDRRVIKRLRTNQIKNNQTVSEINEKIILVWTPFFGDWSWGNQDKILQNYLDGCPVKNCLLTKDRTFLSKANLILFHCRDKVDKWPENRYPNQIYALLCHEPPTTTGEFHVYNNMINVTVTYRRDSEIFLPYSSLAHLEKVQDRVTPYKPKIPLSSKSRMAVWMVSHCGAPSKRDLYVKELAKFIDVDIYGKCGDKICDLSAGNVDCLQKFEKNYKFYIAFENSICHDYVTEKLYLPLRRELIPIVLGGADCSQFVPEHSVINVANFATPRDLAKHLDYLSNNETAYNEYFQWKAYYNEQVQGRKSWHYFCRLCDIVENQTPMKIYGNITNWWHSESTCHNNLVMNYLRN